jgi:GxxExxY protein
VYEEALAHELRLRQIAYERQRNFEILYKGYRVGEGRVDLIINPLWAGKGGKELVLELKAVKDISAGHKRQAQVYMLSLNIDEGAVMNFASEVHVVEVTKPSKARDLAVAKPTCVSGCTVLDLLDASANGIGGHNTDLLTRRGIRAASQFAARCPTVVGQRPVLGWPFLRCARTA